MIEQAPYNLEKISRDEWKRIKKYNHDEMDAFCKRTTIRSMERGIKAATIALFAVLHDDFGFGNERIGRAFDAQSKLLWEIACGRANVSGIQRRLVEQNIVCLKEDCQD